MMKKIIIFIVFLLIWNNVFADDLKVSSNLESWEYNWVIEIYLNSNSKDAKIFYYTDWEWRFDQIKEYNNSPIILKKDTQLNYFANIDEFDSTKIKENYFYIKYPNEISLNYKDEKIFIKNTWSETINIGYWNLKWDNLNTSIQKNTFINPNQNFEFSYIAKDNEKIQLISPDFSVIKDYIYKKSLPIKKQETEIKTQNTNNNDNKENVEVKTEVDTNNSTFENALINSKSSIIENKNITTQIIYPDNFYQTIILFIILIIFVGCYQIFFSFKVANIRKIKKLKKIYK